MNSRWICLALVVLAAGCKTPELQEPPAKPFVGTHWQVVLDLPLAGEQPNMRFGDGRVEGFGGCNKFSAPYLQDSVGAAAIIIRRIDVGRHACEPGVQAVEDRVLAVLQSSTSYRIFVDSMVFSGSAGSLKLKAIP